jgi:hypothetical protein
LAHARLELLRQLDPKRRDQSYPRAMPAGDGWQAIALDDVEAHPWLGTELAWHPLREALGTHIVGMAGYTADRAGQELVEAHRETEGGRGHEEVYVVLRGHARFTLDGEQLEALAGTFVRVDPAVHRQAIATEPGTAVLALGGPPTFVPSASEWIERARPHLRSHPAEARRILDDLAQRRPDSAGVPIGEALLAAAQGDEAGAREHLRAALAQDPSVRAGLEAEPDLARLLPRRGEH